MASKGKMLAAIVVVALLLAVGLWAFTANTKKDTSVTLTDALGRSVTVEQTPEKIISCSPAITEMVCSFGAGDALKGVTSYCDYPDAVVQGKADGTIKVIGKFYSNLDTELIISMAPDVIFMEASVQNSIQQISKLEAAGLKVVVLETATGFETIKENFVLMGKALHNEGKAQQLADTMEAKFDAITEKVKEVDHKLSVMIAIYWDTTSIWIAGNSSFTNEAITRANGINAFANSTSYKQVSVEDVVAADPDLIILAGMAAGNVNVALSELSNNSLLKNLDAVKGGKVYVILGQAENTFIRAGIRIVEGTYLCAMMLYPELFTKILPNTVESDYKQYLPSTW